MGRIGLMGPINYLDRKVPFGSAGGAGRCRLDQDLGGFAEELGSELGLEGLVEGAEEVGSLLFHFGRGSRLHSGGGGALTRGEDEDVHLGECDFFG